jgi:hypothetical protein
MKHNISLDNVISYMQLYILISYTILIYINALVWNWDVLYPKKYTFQNKEISVTKK